MIQEWRCVLNSYLLTFLSLISIELKMCKENFGIFFNSNLSLCSVQLYLLINLKRFLWLRILLYTLSDLHIGLEQCENENAAHKISVQGFKIWQFKYCFLGYINTNSYKPMALWFRQVTVCQVVWVRLPQVAKTFCSPLTILIGTEPVSVSGLANEVLSVLFIFIPSSKLASGNLPLTEFWILTWLSLFWSSWSCARAKDSPTCTGLVHGQR